MKKFKRILVANRGEIAIRIFRAAREMGIRSVAIYSEEDRLSLFRTKADESYLIGKGKSPLDAYLDIDEIISLAKKKGVDAIHPGYGFLSENPEFARKCEEEGIAFIGPRSEVMEKLGDKITSKIVAKEAGVATIPGIEKPIKSEEDAILFAKSCGYPVMIKAAAGGGGRGMRIAESEDELLEKFQSAKNEAKKAFGDDSMFIEKYLDKPKHIEVQILGDEYGNIVHLYERDCSIQRRHQKVIEYTPAFSLPKSLREEICEDALKIAKSIGYSNAGTVEFLVDSKGDHFFIEVNPRIQVEHTVTEMCTDIDIVQSQILIAEGYKLSSDKVGIKSQDEIVHRGFSIQCRVTTEDPLNNFMPDTGQINLYRSSSGFGVRLDGGNGFTGAVISPYYDSLLVKVITEARTWEDTIRKAKRSLSELKIGGVKTNIGFLLNVLNTEEFKKGTCETGFIEEHPELFEIENSRDKELRIMKMLGEKIVNDKKVLKKNFDVPQVPKFEKKEFEGYKQIFDKLGADGLKNYILQEEKLLLTDTTMRDAHQSLMATRMRTVDLVKIAEALNYNMGELFSVEMWGGATFDVAYRFLHEDPWERLKILRDKMPNMLLQMLIRGNNTVGYKNYPDNVVVKFIKESSKNGIDLFRIFDSLNWLPGMQLSIDEVLKNGKIAEATMCYTGDILDEKKDKYSIKYYVDLAKELERTGAQIIGIKDMSGLLKPYAAKKLIKNLKEEVGVPIHLHTHDTTGNGVATILQATEAGVDIVDTAVNSMSGLTSQPALNSVVAALKNTNRDTKIDLDKAEEISKYWAAVRPVYENFESDLKSGTTEIYKYEIPGGQYSNLKPQVESFGLGHKFKDVKEMYKSVNEMVGDIVKVTPSSKMVGDFAIFMVQNDLTPENILEKGKNLDYPDSVMTYFRGMMGQPYGGFPKDLQEMILKGEKEVTVRPGELLEDEDFDKIKIHLEEKGIEPSEEDLISSALYPKVFDDYIDYIKENGEVSRVGSDVFFHGLMEGETAEISIEEGKTLIVTLIEIGKLLDDGTRNLTFEINGSRRTVNIKDKTVKDFENDKDEKIYADPKNEKEIGSSIPGKIVKVLVSEGDSVKKGDKLFIAEAMKMETNIVANVDGKINNVFVREGDMVESGELLASVE
ncbi:pyruvate carboxylase [Peptoniphilus lacydonensis]|uniref:pyruvate carboxylase n=1 Tax=Peptoniphilus lacydonensis TaxID=1673725 RepID=UPI0008DA9AF7|nr:pyruvate carboxylase [Peptoniphilus lacydonensis]MDU5378126.1 pyruvate carboxylase [Peptoniphilus lacydonensis]MDU5437417.1 pyruvate carboxylase [Peptoniphilus lacydonensis]